MKLNQENLGGFPQYISSRMNPIGEDTGIDWSEHTKFSFEVVSFFSIRYQNTIEEHLELRRMMITEYGSP